MGRAIVTSMCDILGVKLNDLDVVSMHYGLEIPIEFCIDEPELDKVKLRKIEM